MTLSMAALVAAIIISIGASTTSNAATGSVRIIISRTGFIFGNGSGTLHFQGKRYPLVVGGVSAGPFGASRVDLVGRAYNLRSAGTIHGVYSAVIGSAASGAKVVRLQNWHGVVLELRGRRGVKPAVEMSGLQISLR